MVKLAIDIMGGDNAPIEIIKGVNIAIKDYEDIELTLFGDENIIKEHLIPSERVKVVHAPHALDMGEKDPIAAIRNNRDLSLVQAFRSVFDKKCEGVITAGPTQGVIAGAHLIVRRLKGMKRVALAPILPQFSGKSRLLLDVGANTDIRAEHIHQHAQYASIYIRETMGVKAPLVGLVNIGTEPGKGRELEQEVFNLLEADESINFHGNVEMKEILTTPCDILVTDGFSGNLVMKTIEGTAKALGTALKEEISKNLSGKIGYLFMRKNLKSFKNRFNPDEIGGAVLFGVDGVIVKAHGSSNGYAFSRAIYQARQAVKGNVVDLMRSKLVENND
jgi:glycerol-3-phosphate acyltransferase PlsX